jgi:hypothetical protein
VNIISLGQQPWQFDDTSLLSIVFGPDPHCDNLGFCLLLELLALNSCSVTITSDLLLDGLGRATGQQLYAMPVR